MEPQVIYGDNSLLILDKPPGWIVNSARTTKGQKVIQEWLNDMAYPLAKNKQMRSGIVHRIDKETSGILLIAKTESAFANLQRQFKERKVKKTYTALVHGKVEPDEGEVNAPVGRLTWNRKRFGILPGGKKAVTKYKVAGYYKKDGEALTLCEFYPRTGRTHQIRVHAKYLGHPIVSDEFYAGRKTSRADRKWCPRLFLHASGVTFTHPKTQKGVSFASDLEPDLKSALDSLTPV